MTAPVFNMETVSAMLGQIKPEPIQESVERKYVMLEIEGIPCPILFEKVIPHRNICVPLGGALKSRKLVSAGFVVISNGKVFAHGLSESLQMQSRPEDSGIIARFLGLVAA
jgi:hypothetical protein